MIKSKYILTGILLIQAGCTHHAYKPQRIDIERHTLILHETRVQMENSYEVANVKDTNRLYVKNRGEYAGFINYMLNELHCYGHWPEECILHEYKHLATKYGLKVPDDPHFKRR